MNKILKLLIITAIVIVPLLTATASVPPPPPPPPGGGGGDPIPIGGTAPIEGGVVILVSMAAAYGAKKIYDARRRLEE